MMAFLLLKHVARIFNTQEFDSGMVLLMNFGIWYGMVFSSKRLTENGTVTKRRNMMLIQFIGLVLSLIRTTKNCVWMIPD